MPVAPVEWLARTLAPERICLAQKRPVCAQGLLPGWAKQGTTAQGLQVPFLVHMQLAFLLSSIHRVCRVFPC